LKRRLEGRAIDLQEISSATRVAVRFLRAIEDDDFKSLPGGLFTRSFIRTYARHVGMDEEEAIARYYSQVGQVKEETKRYGLAGDAAVRVRTSFWASFTVVVAVVGVLALAAWGGYHYWQRSKGPQNESQPIVQSQPTSSQPTSSSPAPLDSGQSSSATPTVEPAQPTTAISQPSSPTGKPETLEMTIANVSRVGPNERATAKSCWISVLTDDQTKAMQANLKAGESRTFSSKEKIKLTIGNVNLVKVTINGQPAEIPSKGLVATDVIITLDNLRQFITPSGR
jgi:cytoskeleton protein RodZ